MPVISVIVPVYNAELFLYRCIESIIHQTFSNYELILIDDGSTDKSGRICDEYAKKDSRIRVIHQVNQGQAVARNKAIDIAKGDYFSFVDSDDYIHPQYLELLVGLMEKYDSDIVVCSFKKGTEETMDWGHIDMDNIKYRISDGSTFYREAALNESDKIWVLWDKLFKKSCFSNVRLPEGRVFEDNAVIYRILYESNRIVDTDYKLYYYYTNIYSTTNKCYDKKKLDWLTVLEEMILYFREKNENALFDFFNLRYLDNAFYQYLSMLEYYPDSPETVKLGNKVRKHFRAIKWKNNLNINNSFVYYRTLFPKYTKYYKKKKRIKNAIKRRLHI